MSNGDASGDADGSGQAQGAVQSVDRAIRILEFLATDGEAGVTEVARELGVHKSTAFRLVATLESHGLVEQTVDRGKYRLGVGLLRLAGTTAARLDLVQEARPLCKALAIRTNETVNVAVLAGHAALYIDQVAGSSALQSHNWVGQHIPLHATSNGKVLISELSEDRLAEVLDARRGALPSYTERTLTKVAELRAELAEIRRTGHSVAVDELETGLTAVAAPIRDAHGDVVASLSVSGPSFRLEGAAKDRAIEAVETTAAEISTRLGWAGSAVASGR